MKIKKVLTMLISASLLLSASITAHAVFEDKIGSTININRDYQSPFGEILYVVNGKTYIPLRMVFANNMDNRKGMYITQDEKNKHVIHLIYGSIPEGVEYDMQRTAIPFDGVRRCVDIVWDGDIENGAQAEMTIMDYTYLDENGMPADPVIAEIPDSLIPDNFREKTGSKSEMNKLYVELCKMDPIYLKSVENDGGRFFVSLDDINKIVKFMGLDNGYSVKLYDFDK